MVITTRRGTVVSVHTGDSQAQGRVSKAKKRGKGRSAVRVLHVVERVEAIVADVADADESDREAVQDDVVEPVRGESVSESTDEGVVEEEIGADLDGVSSVVSERVDSVHSSTIDNVVEVGDIPIPVCAASGRRREPKRKRVTSRRAGVRVAVITGRPREPTEVSSSSEGGAVGSEHAEEGQVALLREGPVRRVTTRSSRPLASAEMKEAERRKTYNTCKEIIVADARPGRFILRCANRECTYKTGVRYVRGQWVPVCGMSLVHVDGCKYDGKRVDPEQWLIRETARKCLRDGGVSSTEAVRRGVARGYWEDTIEVRRRMRNQWYLIRNRAGETAGAQERQFHTYLAGLRGHNWDIRWLRGQPGQFGVLVLVPPWTARFVEHYHSPVYVDTTFPKPDNQVLLTLVGVAGDLKQQVLALALADGETKQAYNALFSSVAWPEGREVTIIADRGAAVVQEIAEWSNMVRCECVWHLAKKIPIGVVHPDVGNMHSRLYTAARTDDAGARVYLDKLRDVGREDMCEVADMLEEHISYWQRAHVRGRRRGGIITLSESFHGVLKRECLRPKRPVRLLMTATKLAMRWYRDGLRRMWALDDVPADEMVEKGHDELRYEFSSMSMCRAKRKRNGKWEVCEQGSCYEVQTDGAFRCTCGFTQDFGLPCRHGLHIQEVHGVVLHDTTDPMWLVGTMRQAFDHRPHPMDDISTSKRAQQLTDELDDQIQWIGRRLTDLKDDTELLKEVCDAIERSSSRASQIQDVVGVVSQDFPSPPPESSEPGVGPDSGEEEGEVRTPSPL